MKSKLNWLGRTKQVHRNKTFITMDVLQGRSLKITFLSSKGMARLFESYRCSETLKEKAGVFC